MGIKPTLEEQEHIELILVEAQSHCMYWEVERTAQKIMREDFASINPLVAYQMAYHTWIK